MVGYALLHRVFLDGGSTRFIRVKPILVRVTSQVQTCLVSLILFLSLPSIPQFCILLFLCPPSSIPQFCIRAILASCLRSNDTTIRFTAFAELCRGDFGCLSEGSRFALKKEDLGCLSEGSRFTLRKQDFGCSTEGSSFAPTKQTSDNLIEAWRFAWDGAPPPSRRKTR